MIDPLKLSNVTVKGRTNGDEYSMREPLKQVVSELAVANPTWRFAGNQSGGEVFRFDVYCEEQEIGILTREYSGRSGGYCVRLESDCMQRIRTKDPKKAIREAKRGFLIKSMDRLMEENMETVRMTIHSQEYDKRSTMHNHLRVLENSLIAFATQEQRESYMNYLSAKDPKLLGLLSKYDQYKAENDVLQKMNELRNSPKAVYIMLHKGKYVVKHLDNVQSYDDNTIPEQYRGKLGMLKLVEPKQCVSDTGCRVSEDLFYIVLE